jgi:prepilin-type N-terminal cleavage/methylation domain-containing protein
MTRLRRDESGFSLIELLAAMAVSSIILTAVMIVFVNGVQGAAKVNDRVDSQQRGRLTMDRIVTLLSSQVCLAASQPPIVAGSTANSVTFYGDLNGASNQPRMYRITYDPAAKTLTEFSWTPSGSLPGAVTYPAAPSVTRQLATGVLPALDSGNVAQPIFSYYRFEADGTVNLANPIPSSPLVATDADDVVEVGVTFAIVPGRTKTLDARSTMISGQALAGSANPASPSAGPNCQ